MPSRDANTMILSQQTTTRAHFMVCRNSYLEPSSSTSNRFEPSDVHYSHAEYAMIESENKMIAKKMKNLDNDQASTRGLETRTLQGARRKSLNRRRPRDAVLAEQDRQQEEGSYDPEMLAEVYKGYSTLCTRQAQTLARRDFQAAREIYFEKEDPYLSFDKISLSTSSCDATESTAATDEESAELFLKLSESEDNAHVIEILGKPHLLRGLACQSKVLRPLTGGRHRQSVISLLHSSSLSHR